MTSLIADLLGRLDDDRRYEFEERAGIIEFENGQPRDLAECFALIDLLRSYAGALIGVTAIEVAISAIRPSDRPTRLGVPPEPLVYTAKCGATIGLSKSASQNANRSLPLTAWRRPLSSSKVTSARADE